MRPAETYCSNMVISKKLQQTFLGFAMGSSRKAQISPIQTWNDLFDNGKIQHPPISQWEN